MDEVADDRAMEVKAINEENNSMFSTTIAQMREQKIEKLSIDIPRFDDDEYLALRAVVPEIRKGGDRSQYIGSFTPPMESEVSEDDERTYKMSLPKAALSPLKGEIENDSVMSLSLRLSDETKMAEHNKK